MAELLRELATLENGLVLGLVAVLGFFLRLWVGRVDSKLETCASVEDVKALAGRLEKMEKAVVAAGLRASGAYRNVVHMSKESAEKLSRVDRDLEAAGNRTGGVEEDVRRLAKELDELQRDVWAGKKP